MIPSGPGAEPVWVFLKASSTCLLETSSVIGPENWSAKLVAASLNMMSTICDALVTVPPSIAAKDLTQPSAALVAVANGIPNSSTSSGMGLRYCSTFFPLVPILSGLSLSHHSTLTVAACSTRKPVISPRLP